MNFCFGKELLRICENEKIPISEAMLRREIHITGTDRGAARKIMERSYQVMKGAVKKAAENPRPSMGGLIGGEAAKMLARGQKTRPVCGAVLSRAAAYALGVMEVNASMGLIVAAPTAGSSGVIPGAFLAVQEEFGFSDEKMTDALFNTAAVGYLITRNATVSGAQSGCQAEVGAASAMAASALAEIMGASPDACLAAASSALSNMLGLVCDPIAGLVEVPCQKRNALGAANALVCAEMALSGIPELIPFDEMVDTLYHVGQRIPIELRETALGGVAASPTGQRLCSEIRSRG
ncbi:MAG: L-serine ammonia-lyase, iron-sulfur-dependent, subunit alpha [Spirochaetales bacterium]|jgi:L-serine dehydratase|nr:L-serine ammonia-lyase, iron-sulfur-dependent, subunit alpha [Spirochaetales bacterium]